MTTSFSFCVRVVLFTPSASNRWMAPLYIPVGDNSSCSTLLYPSSSNSCSSFQIIGVNTFHSSSLMFFIIRPSKGSAFLGLVISPALPAIKKPKPLMSLSVSVCDVRPSFVVLIQSVLTSLSALLGWFPRAVVISPTLLESSTVLLFPLLPIFSLSIFSSWAESW